MPACLPVCTCVRKLSGHHAEPCTNPHMHRGRERETDHRTTENTHAASHAESNSAAKWRCQRKSHPHPHSSVHIHRYTLSVPTKNTA